MQVAAVVYCVKVKARTSLSLITGSLTVSGGRAVWLQNTSIEVDIGADFVHIHTGSWNIISIYL